MDLKLPLNSINANVGLEKSTLVREQNPLRFTSQWYRVLLLSDVACREKDGDFLEVPEWKLEDIQKKKVMFNFNSKFKI